MWIKQQQVIGKEIIKLYECCTWIALPASFKVLFEKLNINLIPGQLWLCFLVKKNNAELELIEPHLKKTSLANIIRLAKLCFMCKQHVR